MFGRKTLAVIITILFFSVLCSFAYANEEAEGRFIVTFKKSALPAGARGGAANVDATNEAVENIVDNIGVDNVESLGLIRSAAVEADADELGELLTDSRVSSIEPDYDVQLNSNDTYYSYLYGVINSEAPNAWGLSRGANVVVGVVDTGIEYTHPDLAANMWQNTAEVAGNGLDDDANGYIDDIYGYDAVNNDGNPMEDHYHGTHVAGTIAAVTDNGQGVAGVAPDAKLMGIKVLGSSGSGSYSGIIAGIQYAIAMKNRGVNVRVLNMSLSGSSYSTSLYNAISQANSAGIIIAAAAGNSARDASIYPQYPAAYNLPNIISVSAVDSTNTLASFSNYGSNVHIAAPGVSTLSTYPLAKGASYAYLSGTSMATPHVAGVLALVFSKNVGLTPVEARTVLTNTGTYVSGLTSKVNSNRVVNAYQAVSGVSTYTISGTVLTGGSPLAGVSIDGGALGTTTTNSNGYYSFSNISYGTSYAISASKTGYSFASASSLSGVISANQTINFFASLLSYSVSGSVTQNGSLLAGVQISAGLLGSTSTDVNGAFSLSMPYGTAYVLTASRSGYTFSPSSFAGLVSGNVSHSFAAIADVVPTPTPTPVPPEDDEEFQDEPEQMFSLGGQVLEKRKGLRDVTVIIFDEGDDSVIDMTTTSRNGSYTFENIPEGTEYRIVVSKRKYRFTPSLIRGMASSSVSNLNFSAKKR